MTLLQRDRSGGDRRSVEPDLLIWSGAKLDLNVPSSVSPDGRVKITGKITTDFGPLDTVTGRFPADVRIKVSSDQTHDRIKKVASMSRQDEQRFEILLPPRAAEGEIIRWTVKAQADNSATWGYSTWEERTASTEVSKGLLPGGPPLDLDLDGVVPWAVGGAGIGLLASNELDFDDRITPSAGGAGAGVAAKVLVDQAGDINIPTGAITAVGLGVAGLGVLSVVRG